MPARQYPPTPAISFANPQAPNAHPREGTELANGTLSYGDGVPTILSSIHVYV